MKRTLALLLLSSFTALPVPAIAQVTDSAYCAALADLSRRYLVGDGGRGRNAPDPSINLAIDNCNNGNPAISIAVLEEKLVSRGFSLPKR